MAVHHPRLAEAIEEYLRIRRARYAEATVTNEAFVLRRFAAWTGDLQVRHLTAQRVAAWFYDGGGLTSNHRTRDGVDRPPIKASTHNFYRLRLASFFRFCVIRGWVRTDLLAEVTPLVVPRRERLQPSPQLLVRMLDHADNDRDRAYLATAMNTGLRASEIVRIRIDDVDLDGGWLRVFISKSSVEDRLPMTAELDTELRRWLTAYGLDLGRPLSTHDHLFPARHGSVYRWTTGPDGTKIRERTAPVWVPNRHMTKTERVVQSALAAVGLPTKHEGTHTLRRAVARAFFDSMASDVGYDAALRTVSALLHHKSSATTEVYLGLSSEKERRDQRLRGKPFLSGLVADAEVVELDQHRRHG